MFFGRVTYGIIQSIIGLVEMNNFTFNVFIVEAVINAIPGIIIQLIIILQQEHYIMVILQYLTMQYWLLDGMIVILQVIFLVLLDLQVMEPGLFKTLMVLLLEMVGITTYLMKIQEFVHY